MPDTRCLPFLVVALSIPLLLAPWGTSHAADATDIQCCQHLDPAELARAEAIMQQQFLYDCCDDTVASCLAEQAQACPLAGRLTGEICRRVGAGESDERIDQALRLRARSMMTGGPAASITLEGKPVVGAEQAPVTVVVYACITCPFCAALIPELEREVRDGTLQGKVKLVFALFPIKGHEGSVDGGLSLLAAHAQGRFWDYLDLAYARFDSLGPDKLEPWATELGLDMATYGASITDPATRQALVDSKREGMAAGVASTPTFFIDGRRYEGELELVQLLDVLGEEVERLTASAGASAP
jgi:protein-disulfide isomerase